MKLIVVLPYYIRWHYRQALSDMIVLWKDFLVFLYNFFSIRTLFSTLFSPFERMGEGYSRGFDIQAFFGTLLLNMIMRIVGAIVRSSIILLGIISICIGILMAVALSLAWLFLPALLLFLFIAGCADLIM